jgi:hypothetical protein
MAEQGADMRNAGSALKHVHDGEYLWHAAHIGGARDCTEVPAGRESSGEGRSTAPDNQSPQIFWEPKYYFLDLADLRIRLSTPEYA